MIDTKTRELFVTEYGIIQAKIDQFGEFRFRVKGWSFTLISTSLALVVTSDVNSYLSFLFLLIPVSFLYLSEEQRVKQRSVSDRAVRIEKLLSILNKIGADDIYQRPKRERQINTLMDKLGEPLMVGRMLRKESKIKISSIVFNMFHIKKNWHFHAFHYFAFLVHLLILALSFIVLKSEEVKKITIVQDKSFEVQVEREPALIINFRDWKELLKGE